MLSVLLPEICKFSNLARVIDYNKLDKYDWMELAFKIPSYCYLDCTSIAYLAAWSMSHISDGRTVYFSGSPRVTQYLSRMDLFNFIGLDIYEHFKRKTAIGRFIPVRKICSGGDIAEIVNTICDLITHHFDNARDIIPAFEWTTNEIIDNIINHASIKSPAAVCAQYREDKSRLEIGIVDCGIGIKASLDESLSLKDHGHALIEALKRGVTRNPEVGQGNGLAGSKEILLNNKGSFCLWSGDAEYCIDNGEEIGLKKCGHIKGTAIYLSLDINKPVDLSQTFIGRSSWSYIEAECERISEQGGIRVSDECHDTATRETAKRFRRKILAMLPDMYDKLYIDFSDTTRASSSFLDELLGRLFLELGVDDFLDKIGVINMNSALMDMANVVIRQRLHGLEDLPLSKRTLFTLKWRWK